MPIFNPTSIVGTANQVLVNGTTGVNESGIVTLTLPQNIGSGASPSFSTVTSTVSTGTAPFVVSSTTPVANLTSQYSSNTLITTTSANTDFPITLAPTTTTGNQNLLMDVQLKYNPSTDSMYIPANGSFNIGTLTYTPANSGFNLQNSAGTYVQVIVQNSNGSSASSADFVVNNELSTDSTYYGDFGINSGTFSGTGSLSLPNATYLTSTTGDLSIGSTTSNPIHFVIGGSATDAFTIGTAGQWGIAGSFGTAGQIFRSGGPSAAPSWVTLSGLAVTSLSGGTTGLTPNTATTGAITLAGTLIAANGGTGFASYAVGDLLYANTTTTLAKLADVATGNALISGGVGVAPTYGKIGLTTHVSGILPVANGGTNLSTTPTNGQLLIGNGTGYTLASLTAGAGISVTPGAGSIALANTGVTSFTITQPAAGITATNTGSVQTGSASTVLALSNDLAGIESLATTGFAVRTATDTWATRTISAGTGVSITNGDGIAGNPSIANTGVLSFSAGTTGLTPNTATTGAVTLAGTLSVSNGGTGLTTAPTNGQIDIGNGTGFTRSTLTAGTGISITNGSGTISVAALNNGTVTSVALALPSIFSVSGSPITASGTLTGSLVTQTANTVFAGPATGVATVPAFRTISLLQNDISDVVLSAPSSGQVLTYNSGTSKWNNTSVLAGNATGTVGVSPTGGGTAWTLVSGTSYRADFVHNLGTTNVVVTLWDTSNNSVVIANSLVTTDTNTVRITVIGNTKTIKVVVVANGASIVAGGSTPSSVITAYEGVTVSTAATKLNFQGQAVGVTDAGSGTTNITIGSRFTFFANSLDTPVNSDFAINAIAPVTTDPTYASLNVRSFSNTVEQGVACLVSIPSGATTMTVKIRGRAQTAPGAASVVQPRLYARLLPNNSAVGAWSAAKELTNIAIPTNANFQYYTYSATLSSLTLTASNLYQFEFTRRVTGVTGTNLAANFLLAELTVEFA